MRLPPPPFLAVATHHAKNVLPIDDSTDSIIRACKPLGKYQKQLAVFSRLFIGQPVC